MVIIDRHPGAVSEARGSAYMEGRILRFPTEARAAWRLGVDARQTPDMGLPRRVVVCGMGGSAIGGDFLRIALRHALTVEVVRDYELPPCDDGTLLVASSYSGNTEETIAALQSPQARLAHKLVLSTGGRLATLAAERGIDVIEYETAGPPRTAWEFGFLPILGLLSRLGVATDLDGPVDAALEALESQAPVLQAFAAVLAPQLAGRIPFIVGADHLAPVARRWACQLNENSKRVAFFGEVPEINHNFLLALTDRRADAMVAILLDSELSNARARRRVDLTEQLLRDQSVAYERVLVPGVTPIDVMLRGALLGDWLSWELAVADDVDPTDTATLERFKKDLVLVPAPH